MAIKALSQQTEDAISRQAEPCDDAISRQATVERLCKVAEFMNEKRDGLGSPYVMAALFIQDNKDEFPSVTPKQRTGHWIETAEEYYKAVNEYGGGVNEDTPYFVDDIACSVCLAKYSVIDNETERFDCCPSCGAKMESEGTQHE
jgi:hypothetical protein